jgi:hypothetical protein
MTPEDELAALKARVAELEAKAKPPKPFMPEPYQRFDPTANISMPISAMREMVNAAPDWVIQGIVRDNRAPGNARVIPDRRTEVHADRRSLGTGWARQVPLSNPPGVAQADRLMEEQDRRDRHELVQREEARRRAELARKR